MECCWKYLFDLNLTFVSTISSEIGKIEQSDLRYLSYLVKFKILQATQLDSDMKEIFTKIAILTNLFSV